MNNDYTLHVDLKERSAKMLFPFIAASGDDVHFLSKQFSGIESFVVKTSGKNAEVLIWWDFGSQIPERVWTGLGVGDYIAKIDKDYAEQVCKEAVFEYVKAKLIKQVYSKIWENIFNIDKMNS